MSYDYVVIIMNNSKSIRVDCCLLGKLHNILIHRTTELHGCYIARYCLGDVTIKQLKDEHANIARIDNIWLRDLLQIYKSSDYRAFIHVQIYRN